MPDLFSLLRLKLLAAGWIEVYWQNGEHRWRDPTGREVLTEAEASSRVAVAAAERGQGDQPAG